MFAIQLNVLGVQLEAAIGWSYVRLNTIVYAPNLQPIKMYSLHTSCVYRAKYLHCIQKHGYY
jgi:hypothetical protein